MSVTLTGTGIPHPSPGRAGPGALVRVGEVALQCDFGRGTVLRLAELALAPPDVEVALVTHVHSDHVVDLADFALTHWILQQVRPSPALRVVAPRGAPSRFVERLFDPYDDDIRVRRDHVGADAPRFTPHYFDVSASPVEVWRRDDPAVLVEAVGVHHEPVREAVAYRVTANEGVVVISGDTRVCGEMEEFCRGADVVVHEACRQSALREAVAGTTFERIFSYHADTVALGAMAERAEIGHLVLTHLIPAPRTPDEARAFADDVRAGGFRGPITVGEDLVTIEVGTAS